MVKPGLRALAPVLLLALVLSWPAAYAPAQETKNYAAKGGLMYVRLITDQGDMVLELNAEAAPRTVANFVEYVKAGHYDGTIFHRVIPGFMIQGGGMDADMRERPTGPPIENEARNGLLNDPYTVAMARTSDPHSATAQFFINVKKNDFLNFSATSPAGWGYAVFGRIAEGRQVADKIEKVPTTSRSFHDDVPVEPIIIKKAELLTDYPGDRK